jgi:hypothetical protein
MKRANGDLCTALKKKHNKSAETRFDGTVLGKAVDSPVKIEGGVESIQEWLNVLNKDDDEEEEDEREDSPLSSLGDMSD